MCEEGRQENKHKTGPGQRQPLQLVLIPLWLKSCKPKLHILLKSSSSCCLDGVARETRLKERRHRQVPGVLLSKTTRRSSPSLHHVAPVVRRRGSLGARGAATTSLPRRTRVPARQHRPHAFAQHEPVQQSRTLGGTVWVDDERDGSKGTNTCARRRRQSAVAVAVLGSPTLPLDPPSTTFLPASDRKSVV